MVSLRPLTARSYKSKSKKYKKISNFVVPTTGKFTANIHFKERRLSKKKNGIKTVELSLCLQFRSGLFSACPFKTVVGHWKCVMV